MSETVDVSVVMIRGRGVWLGRCIEAGLSAQSVDDKRLRDSLKLMLVQEMQEARREGDSTDVFRRGSPDPWRKLFDLGSPAGRSRWDVSEYLRGCDVELRVNFRRAKIAL